MKLSLEELARGANCLVAAVGAALLNGGQPLLGAEANGNEEVLDLGSGGIVDGWCSGENEEVDAVIVGDDGVRVLTGLGEVAELENPVRSWERYSRERDFESSGVGGVGNDGVSY